MNSPLTSDLRPATSGFDLLRLPLLGRFLKWRHARLCLQVPLLLLAAVTIYDGLRGPQVGAMNLAGVLPWIHWRGLLVLGLLVAGNVFCMGCPFLLPRTLARRWLPAGWSWPRRLRNKWLAVLLLVAFLWAYEAFALWDRPWLTAWLALGYFVAAFVIDGLFRGASFCKYVCPIGQFNFVQSLVSPLEVKVRDPAVCDSCRTKDCIRGRDGIPGCELHLFLPRKVGQHGLHFLPRLRPRLPARQRRLICRAPRRSCGTTDALRHRPLWRAPTSRPWSSCWCSVPSPTRRAWSRRVLEWRDRATSLARSGSPLLVTSISYVLGLVVLPALLVGGSAASAAYSAACRHLRWSWPPAFRIALVPLGFSMWLAHYSYHFLASWSTVTPALQRFAGDLGCSILGEPAWALACCRPVADWLPRLEILSLDVGLLLSLYSGYRIALTQSGRTSQALKMLAPWAALLVLLFAAGVWIVLQPMQMRGTLSAAG